jgi:hypothetical protein
MKRVALAIAVVPLVGAFVVPSTAAKNLLATKASPPSLRSSHLRAEGKNGGGLFGGLFGPKKPQPETKETPAKAEEKNTQSSSKSEPRRTIGGGMYVFV